MKIGRQHLNRIGKAVLVLGGLLLLVPTGDAWAQPFTTAAQVCAFSTNACAAGVADINADTLIADGAILDFVALGFPKLNINAGGQLRLEDKSIPQVTGLVGFQGCLTGGVALGDPAPG